MTFAVCFTNFGPYHLARLRALADRLAKDGNRLVAYEVADREQTYPWSRSRLEEPFTWITLFPDRVARDDRTGRLPESDGRGTRSGSTRCAGPGRLRAARIDGGGAVGPAARTTGHPHVGKPGRRSAPPLVERADQDAARPPV